MEGRNLDLMSRNEDTRDNIQSITNKRIDWINEVRNILAEYIAIAQECANKLVLDKKIVIPEKDYRDLNICLAKLRLLSNFAKHMRKKYYIY